MFQKLFLGILFICTCGNSMAQVKDSAALNKNFDSTSKKNILALDTTAKQYNPKVATFRSAVLPGWGQAYNKKYWKIPIIYGALGVTAGVFAYNLKTYKQLKKAVILRSDNDVQNDTQIVEKFSHLSLESLRKNRNTFRQNVDYSVLFFLVFWGLNVVDATVDAHLKAFDVGNNISMRLKPGYDPYGKKGGISLVFEYKQKSKVLPSPR